MSSSSSSGCYLDEYSYIARPYYVIVLSICMLEITRWLLVTVARCFSNTNQVVNSSVSQDDEPVKPSSIESQLELGPMTEKREDAAVSQDPSDKTGGTNQGAGAVTVVGQTSPPQLSGASIDVAAPGNAGASPSPAPPVEAGATVGITLAVSPSDPSSVSSSPPSSSSTQTPPVHKPIYGAGTVLRPTSPGGSSPLASDVGVDGKELSEEEREYYQGIEAEMKKSSRTACLFMHYLWVSTLLSLVPIALTLIKTKNDFELWQGFGYYCLLICSSTGFRNSASYTAAMFTNNAAMLRQSSCLMSSVLLSLALVLLVASPALIVFGLAGFFAYIWVFLAIILGLAPILGCLYCGHKRIKRSMTVLSNGIEVPYYHRYKSTPCQVIGWRFVITIIICLFAEMSVHYAVGLFSGLGYRETLEQEFDCRSSERYFENLKDHADQLWMQILYIT